MQFFGISVTWIGIGCLVLAGLFLLSRVRPQQFTSGPNFLILRWGNSLVWLCFALSCFIAPNTALGGTATAVGLIAVAFVCYVAVKVTQIRDRLLPKK